MYIPPCAPLHHETCGDVAFISLSMGLLSSVSLLIATVTVARRHATFLVKHRRVGKKAASSKNPHPKIMNDLGGWKIPRRFLREDFVVKTRFSFSVGNNVLNAGTYHLIRNFDTMSFCTNTRWVAQDSESIVRIAPFLLCANKFAERSNLIFVPQMKDPPLNVPTRSS